MDGDTMQRVLSRFACVGLATLVATACTDTESATNLNPEGPPMVRQVRLFERYLDDGMPPRERTRRVFAFGTHELADPSEVHEVTSAAAFNGGTLNPMRIIMDELLVGNNLEEVACRGTVDLDALDRVPLGATPEDIARCSSADDVLPRTCPASNPKSMCICKNDTGCLVGSELIMKGMPVGILDIDQDGAADETRMIPGAVGIRCATTNPAMALVPIDLDKSYWNPSGDQNRPAMGGFDALGPAIVLTPAGALPTNAECSLVFADGSNPDVPAITDKQGEIVCAPAGGDPDAGCTAGNLDAFKFKVEPIKIEGLSIGDGQTGVGRDLTAEPIDFSSNVPLKAAALTTTTITIAPAVAGLTITLTGTGMRTVRLSGATLAANTMYTITFTPGVLDSYDQALPQPVVVTFTTGA